MKTVLRITIVGWNRTGCPSTSWAGWRKKHEQATGGNSRVGLRKPYAGSRIPLFDGAKWKLKDVSESGYPITIAEMAGLVMRDYNVESELDRLSRLEQNWDYEGARPLDKEIIEAARQFVHFLPADIASCSRVVPMSAGNLQFEWDNGDKILELEFETAQTIRFLQWHPEQGIEEEDTFFVSDIGRAIELIQWCMEEAK